MNIHQEEKTVTARPDGEALGLLLDPEQEKKAYGDLFDLWQRNASAQNGSTSARKDAFLSSVHQKKLLSCDLLELATGSREAFVQSAYFLLLYRYPDEGAMEAWRSRKNMNEWTFRSRLVGSLIQSEEARQYHTEVHNNPYSNREEEERAIDPDKTGLYPGLERPYHLYQRLPQSIRNAIKKVVGRS